MEQTGLPGDLHENCTKVYLRGYRDLSCEGTTAFVQGLGVGLDFRVGASGVGRSGLVRRAVGFEGF